MLRRAETSEEVVVVKENVAECFRVVEPCVVVCVRRGVRESMAKGRSGRE